MQEHIWVCLVLINFSLPEEFLKFPPDGHGCSSKLPRRSFHESWMDGAGYDIQLCAVLRTNNGLAETQDSRAYRCVWTLPKSSLITRMQGSIHISFDWPAGPFLAINDLNKSTRLLNVWGGTFSTPFCVQAVGLVRRLPGKVFSLLTLACISSLAASDITVRIARR